MQYFMNAFVCKVLALKSCRPMQAARAQYGVSCGQKLMENFGQVLGMRNMRKEIGMLVEWKNDRYVEKKIR